jgi:hypothetical protein
VTPPPAHAFPPPPTLGTLLPTTAVGSVGRSSAADGCFLCAGNDADDEPDAWVRSVLRGRDDEELAAGLQQMQKRDDEGGDLVGGGKDYRRLHREKKRVGERPLEVNNEYLATPAGA